MLQMLSSDMPFVNYIPAYKNIHAITRAKQCNTIKPSVYIIPSMECVYELCATLELDKHLSLSLLYTTHD